MHKFAFLVSSISLLACSAASHADPASPSGDFRYQKTLAAGAKVEIRSVNGGVVAEPASGDVLEVVAIKSGPDAARVQVVAREEGGGVLVCALWPGADPATCRGGTGGAPRDSEAKVEFRVRIPATSSFTVRTLNGEVRAKGFRGEAKLATMNGAIDVDSAGAITAETSNGAVTAHAAAGNAVSLQTMNGRVTVFLPPSAGADVDASTTNGRIQSDFGPVPPPTLPALHAASFKVGAGGAKVHLRTTNGDVAVRRL
jgi:Toastrack DUF4097